MASLERLAVPDEVPAMSVAIAAEQYETIRKLMRHLRAQTVRERLEVIIAVPSADALASAGADLEGFCRVRVVEVGPFRVLARARAAAVRQATAPIVALAESHSFPVPEWAEAFIAAHRRPWAVVGPSMRNANPAGMISWANLLLDYGPWVESAGGEVSDVPGHNSAYRREILLDCGSELEAMLDTETILHWELLRRGHRFYLEPRATTYHVNVSLLSVWLEERFHAGRVFAAARARGWSRARRLLFAGGSPLIPLIRMRRIVQDIRRAGLHRRLLPGVLPALLIGLVVSAVGEMVGYATGAGKSRTVVSRFELYKLDYVSPQERQAILSEPVTTKRTDRAGTLEARASGTGV